jgi:hypothetical protein
VILNGGTSSTMEEHAKKLKELGIKFAVFREPDLNNSLSGISFLVDERVFDKKTYPEQEEWLFNIYDGPELIDDSDEEEKYYKFLGGEKIYNIREWLKGFRLA